MSGPPGPLSKPPVWFQVQERQAPLHSFWMLSLSEELSGSTGAGSAQPLHGELHLIASGVFSAIQRPPELIEESDPFCFQRELNEAPGHDKRVMTFSRGSLIN